MFGKKKDPKAIFGPYMDGRGNAVYGDPAELHDRMVYALGGNPDKALDETKSADPETKFNALQKWVQAVVFALDLKAFDKATGEGMQRSDIITLGNTFAEYLKKKETKADASQTGSEPSTSSPSHSTTRRTSDCGCT
jgi:hypothetical protein